jgi:hypothetical protein
MRPPQFAPCHAVPVPQGNWRCCWCGEHLQLVKENVSSVLEFAAPFSLFYYTALPVIFLTALTLRQAIWRKDDPRWSACGFLRLTVNKVIYGLRLDKTICIV